MQYELERWLRMLEFIKEENTLLKQRLGEMVHLETDKRLLRQAEAFQNYFLNNDAITAMLKNDIHKHQQLLLIEVIKNEASAKKVQKEQQILRGDMEKLEKNFSKLNLDFNTYIDDATSEYKLVV